MILNRLRRMAHKGLDFEGEGKPIGEQLRRRWCECQSPKRHKAEQER